MEIIRPSDWADYELIDTGTREKLERFGKFVLARPEPQAVWSKALPDDEWKRMADAHYIRKPGGPEGERGEWIRKPGMPDQWTVTYDLQGKPLHFRLGLTAFGHIGVFPEQASNWEYICKRLKERSSPGKVLNLFAYTGGASLAARHMGADVTHVDSVKPVISWAREIMEASGMDGIRWVVEDALKFVRREAKRGNRYNGIILDPPAYGRGPEGEKWVLEESVNEMISLCNTILAPENAFIILSLYSMGFSSLIGENLIRNHFQNIQDIESGELCFSDRNSRYLPLGTVVRAYRS